MTTEAAQSVAPHLDVAPATGRSLDRWTIEPWKRGLRPRLHEVWRYRRLLLFFARKSITRMYRRTKLGWLWLFIRPLFPLAVKTVIFGGLLSVQTDGVPYFLFLVTSSTVWELFAAAVNWGTRSLDMNRGFIKQIYIPRVILPLAAMSPALVTFLIYMGVLAAAFIGYGIVDRHMYLHVLNLGWALLAVVMALALAFSIALWTSVPTMTARDVRFTLSYVLGFWVFLTPVMYPLSSVPPKWRTLMLLNPMAPIVETFKYGVLGLDTIEPWRIGVAALLILTIMASGLWFFFRAEVDAADRV